MAIRAAADVTSGVPSMYWPDAMIATAVDESSGGVPPKSRYFASPAAARVFARARGSTRVGGSTFASAATRFTSDSMVMSSPASR